MSSELQRLRDRVAELEDVLGLTADIPRALFPRHLFPSGQFTLKCYPFLGMLLAREFVGKYTAYDALFGDRPECDQPKYGVKYIDVIVCLVRKGLNPHGIAVVTVAGKGWYIDNENKAKLRTVIEQLQKQKHAA